jgi:hypothetical protein
VTRTPPGPFAPRRRAFVLALAIAPGLGACLTPGQRREDTLLQNARFYNDDIRWGRYEKAAESLPAEDVPRFLERCRFVGEELVMGDSEVLSVKFGNPTDTAVTTVKVEWYGKSDSTVRTATIEQSWEFRAARWVLIKERRLRGDRFPLVLEPASPPAETKTPPAPTPPAP